VALYCYKRAGDVVAKLLEELLESCKRGEEEAVRELVGRFSRHARQLATALLDDEHLAEDAVQEAFIMALSRLPQLREPNSFAAWFRQIVRSEANRISRRRRESADDRQSVAGADPRAPADTLERDERRDVVRRAVAQLPRAQRETTELFYLEDLSQAQIAARMEIPRGTVRRRLHDAREQLRTMLLGYVAEGKPPKIPEAPAEERMPL
jgi:RNA polymerase sigma factor (sigma-70 family)